MNLRRESRKIYVICGLVSTKAVPLKVQGYNTTAPKFGVQTQTD